MHIGVGRPMAPPYATPDVDAAIVARLAEDAGFESILFGEHTITPTDEGKGHSIHTEGVPFFQEPIVALSRVSGATTRLKFGFGVCLVPQHNPVRLAKQLACLDFYSGGRLIVGIGTGWSRDETVALGGRFERRWGQVREIVGLWRKLWTGERVDHQGEFFQIPPVRCFPTPAQTPGPPVLIGSVTDAALQRLVDYCDGWMPAFVTPETVAAGPDTIRAGKARILELAKASGRAMSDVRVTAIIYGKVDRDLLKRFEDAGVERLNLMLPYFDTEAGAREQVARMAEIAL